MFDGIPIDNQIYGFLRNLCLYQETTRFQLNSEELDRLCDHVTDIHPGAAVCLGSLFNLVGVNTWYQNIFLGALLIVVVATQLLYARFSLKRV